MNLSVLAQTFLFPTSLVWYKANYVLCMGVLMNAIVVWQNSLVFHSIDKLTSIYIHVLPPLTVHLYRWGLIESSVIEPADQLSLTDLVLWPSVLYLAWQAAFLLTTEVILAEQLSKDPSLVTSVRSTQATHCSFDLIDEVGLRQTLVAAFVKGSHVMT